VDDPTGVSRNGDIAPRDGDQEPAATNVDEPPTVAWTPPSTEPGPGAPAPRHRRGRLAAIGAGIVGVLGIAGAKLVIGFLAGTVVAAAISSAFGGPWDRLPSDTKTRLEARLDKAFGDSLKGLSSAEAGARIRTTEQNGLRRLDDATLLERLQLQTKALGSTDTATCATAARASLAGTTLDRGHANAMLGTLDMVSLGRWFEIAVEAIEAESRGAPPTRSYTQDQANETIEALIPKLSGTQLVLFRSFMSGSSLTDENTCMVARALYAAGLQLDAALEARFALMDVSPSEANTAAVSPVPSVVPSASPTPSPTPSPSPTPTPVPLPTAHCPATDTTRNPGAAASSSGRSPRWVGYGIYPAQGSTVSCVEGSWIEPKPQCPKLGNSEAFIFVGIDGLASLDGTADPTLEQVGTHVQCFNGRATHFAFHEVMPSSKYTVPISGFTVGGGDRIWAMITVSGSRFTFTIKNLTHPQSFSTSTTLKTAPRSVADWAVGQAVKAGCDSCSIDLVPFGDVTFTGAYVTVAGHRAPIIDPVWYVSRFDLFGDASAATVSSLSVSGTSFKATWVHK
jgi:hypothetical protein